MSIPFIDLQAQQNRIRAKIQSRIDTVLSHGKYIMGPEVSELEEKLADYVGVKHCIGVSSGSDALLLALMALGVGQGDEVITTPFSFIATAEIICLLGARPVFVDINDDDFNIDTSLIEASITDKTKAIMPVSLYGQCADFAEINAIAAKHKLAVIEDAAQSFGAEYSGKKSCSLSTIGCTSFFPSKPLGCYGDGGACFTDDDDLALAIKQIRVHGQEKRYFHSRLGVNARLDTLQAAILLEKFAIFPEEVMLRAKIGDNYSNALSEYVVTPHIHQGRTSVYAQYTIKTQNRDDFINSLNKTEVPTAVHYPMPLHHQPAISGYVRSDMHFPVAESSATNVVSLPMHPYMSSDDQQFVIDAVISASS